MTVEMQAVPRLKDVHPCPFHPGRVGVDKHPCMAVVDRETGERCGYFESEAGLESCEDSPVYSGQMDMLNSQVEMEL